MRFITHPIALALLAGLAAYVLFSVIFPTTCVDGWASPSIGLQGACSSHGGVARSLLYLRILGAVVAATGVWLVVARFRQPAPNARAIETPGEAAAIPKCPECGAPLRAVTASSGPARYRWECTAFPSRHVIRSIPAPGQSVA